MVPDIERIPQMRYIARIFVRKQQKVKLMHPPRRAAAGDRIGAIPDASILCSRKRKEEDS
jgi:hypothetical protein